MCRLIMVFSRVFRRKNPVIKIGLSGRRARSWLTFWLTFLQIRFSSKVFNLRASNFTPDFFRVCFHVMPCSFQLVPMFLVKNAILEIGIICIFFAQIFVYIQKKIQNYSRYLDEPLYGCSSR